MTTPCTEKETIAVLKTYQKDIREDVKDIKKALLGTDKEGGLITQVAIHKKYFKIIAAIGGSVATFIMARIVWAWINGTGV